MPSLLSVASAVFTQVTSGLPCWKSRPNSSGSLFANWPATTLPLISLEM